MRSTSAIMFQHCLIRICLTMSFVVAVHPVGSAIGQDFGGSVTEPGTQRAVPVAPAKQSRSDEATPVAAMSLDEILATALEHNPDIQVAEAKVQEANAELNRVRLDVAQRVMVHRHEWEAQKARIAANQAALATARRAVAKTGGLVTRHSVQEAEANLQVDHAALNKLEAEMNYLLGRGTPRERTASGSSRVAMVYRLENLSPDEAMGLVDNLILENDGSVSVNDGNLVVVASEKTLTVVRALLEAVDRAGKNVKVRQSPRSKMQQKVQAALDTSVTVMFKDSRLPDILDIFAEKVDISFIMEPLPESRVPAVTLDLGEVPLAVALQAIEDTVGVHFFVRDYGIFASFGPGPGVHIGTFFKEERDADKNTSFTD